MERSRAFLLLTLLGVSGVWFSRISGEEVEMRVRRGDDIILYSDCVVKTGFKTLWFRESSPELPPTILAEDTVYMNHPRYSFVWNSSSQVHDLLLNNVSESDLGLYYCALQRNIPLKTKHGKKSNKGNRTIRLRINDSTVPYADVPKTTPTPPVSDCSVCWKLLVSVCPVCVLLISICVYCIYRYRTTGHILPTTRSEGGAEQRGNTARMGKSNEVREEEEEVCYASLDLPSRGQEHLKKKQKRKVVESSDFSIYSEVKIGRV